MKNKLKKGDYVEFPCSEHLHHGIYVVDYIFLTITSVLLIGVYLNKPKYLLLHESLDLKECKHGLKLRAITNHSEIDLIKLSL